MWNEKNMTCIICPNGCELKVKVEGTDCLEVSGGLCDKGLAYAKNEVLNPVRVLTTTVKVQGGNPSIVSVKSDRPIPRKLLKEAVHVLQGIVVDAPVGLHQVILEDILGTGAKIIATREIN